MSSGVIGGAERFVETCLDFHTEDIEAQIFFLNDGPFYSMCLEKYGATKVTLSPVKVRLRNPFTWILFQFYFTYFLIKRNFSILQATMPYSQIFSAIPSFLTRTRNIWFQHGPIGPGIDRLASLLPCYQILFNSNYTKNEHDKIKILSHRSTVLRLAQPVLGDKLIAKDIRSRWLRASGTLYICAGRICEWKGLEIALESLARQKNQNNTLLIIGMASSRKDKKYLETLLSLVHELKIKEQVHFIGFKPNLSDYILAADAVFHTSLIPEPFGLIVSESVSLGTTIFASNHGGVVDQIKDSELAIGIDAVEKEAKIEELSAKIGVFQDLKQNSSDFVERKKVDSNTRVLEMVSKLESIYRL